MAFVFTLDVEDLFVKGVQKNDEEIATIDIGYDDENRTTYKALVALVPVTAHPPSYRELFFGIIESGPHGVKNNYNSGLGTKTFLTGADRAQVLLAISQLACHMVEKCDPQVLVINTVETYLPLKALVKYDAICEVICVAGYSVGRVDGYHGSEQWQLKKN